MIQIALAGFEGTAGAQLGRSLAESLGARKYTVATFQPGPSIVQAILDAGIDPDVLYLYVRVPDERAKVHLDELQKHWREHGRRPLVQCVLEKFFGARYQLSLEERMARVSYAPRGLEEGKQEP